MTNKTLLLSFVLGGMLLSNVRTMPAPTPSELKNSAFTNGQEPLEAARDGLINRRTQDMRRALSAAFATDAEGKHLTADFTQNDKKIFLVWQDRTGTKGDHIRVSWTTEAVNGFSKGQLLSEETETLPGDGTFKSSFYLSPAKAALPLGTYRANLYKNTTLVRTLKFTVKPRP